MRNGGGGVRAANISMKLADIVRRAMIDPEFRLALEAGMPNSAEHEMSSFDLEALSEAMRSFKGAAKGKLLSDLYALNPVPDWREE
jgi:hypothetical protein